MMSCRNAMHYARRSGDQGALRSCDMAHLDVVRDLF
jgi:hypothetical protein